MNNNQNLLNNQPLPLPVHADENTKQTYLLTLSCKGNNFIKDLLLQYTDIGTQTIRKGEEAPIFAQPYDIDANYYLLKYAISIGDIVTIELALRNEHLLSDISSMVTVKRQVFMLPILLDYAIQYGQTYIVDLINKYTSCFQDDTTANAALTYAFHLSKQEIVDLIFNSNPQLADSYQAGVNMVQALSLEIA